MSEVTQPAFRVATPPYGLAVTRAIPAFRPRPAAPTPPQGRADLVFVLLLLQATLSVLAMLGIAVLMGSPLYAPGPLVVAVVFVTLASLIVRGRRWALWAVFVVEVLTLIGYQLNLLLGLLPQVDVTVNLVGLLTSLGLPLAVAWQCVRLLVRS